MNILEIKEKIQKETEFKVKKIELNDDYIKIKCTTKILKISTIQKINELFDNNLEIYEAHTFRKHMDRKIVFRYKI